MDYHLPTYPTRGRGRAGPRSLLTSALVLLLSFGAAWGASPLRVTVSIAPYADVVERIGGQHVDVVTFLPPGASEHAFDPTPSQAAGLTTSDLIVMNGGLDSWLARLVQAAAPDVPVLTVVDSIAFTPVQGGHHEEDSEDHDEDDHLGPNPHVWLDPTLMAKAGEAIAAELARLDPANSEAYSAGLQRLEADLAALDAEIAALLAPVRGAPFVPFHDAWPYFARRYGLDVVLTLEPFPGREPSTKYVAEAVATVKAVGAKAVFAERQLNPRSAEVVAESAGVKLATLDPIGGAPGPVTYEELLRFNARTILDNLR